MLIFNQPNDLQNRYQATGWRTQLAGAGRWAMDLYSARLRPLLPWGEGARRADEAEGRSANQGLSNRQNVPYRIAFFCVHV